MKRLATTANVIPKSERFISFQTPLWNGFEQIKSLLLLLTGIAGQIVALKGKAEKERKKDQP
jgi:hypothetical protein